MNDSDTKVREEDAAQRIRELEAQVRALRERLLAATQALRRSQDQLRAAYASRSWRVTAPLRLAGSWLRKYRHIIAAMTPGSSVRAEKRKRAAASNTVRELRAKMRDLGFHERAAAELRAGTVQEADPHLRQLAAWELSVWHANMQTPDDAQKCLRLLDIVTPVDEEQARRIAILRAESFALLGEIATARAILEKAIDDFPHADLFLGLASLEDSEEHRLARINQALSIHSLGKIGLDGSNEKSLYDRLCPLEEPARELLDGPQVSVIVPAFNAERTITTTIGSLLNQTWKNLEVLVADDCSTDRSTELVERLSQEDHRVRLVRSTSNSGPYVARNLALQRATGELVTCNDADDWSHPQKIEIQVKHLLEDSRAVANLSQQARAFADLRFHRRGNPGFYVQPNMSSLMFRREMLLNNVGYWDSVRFAGDSEYLSRIKRVFGESAVVNLDTGPLCFQRQTQDSLTASLAFGYRGFKMGARRAYEEAHERFHALRGRVYIPFPLARRPFVVPEPMRLTREVAPGQRRHFDVIIASDFRMPGGTTMSNAEEIIVQRELGLRTGLVQMPRYDADPARGVNPKIADLIDADRVDLVVYGEKVRCDLLIVRLPLVLENVQEYVPDIEADHIRVIVNQPPKADYGPNTGPLYHIPRCAENVRKYFGKPAVWHPIGPLVREALVQHHSEDLHSITLSNDDWANIINVEDWRRPIRPVRHSRVRICRHSRDQYVKWPATRAELLSVYPDSERFEVHILGGGETPKALLGGRLPPRWFVTEFGEEAPADFLAKFDVFVYYTHPEWVESFGRVIFEAMSVGLPVFLPECYQPLFEDAAIYAAPADVVERIEQLMADDHLYDSQVNRALSFVRSRFGHSTHAARVREIINMGT